MTWRRIRYRGCQRQMRRRIPLFHVAKSYRSLVW
jgi:hypothetical protein